MAKLLASSLSLHEHLYSLDIHEEYDFQIIGSELIWGKVIFHGEGKGCDQCLMTRPQLLKFINILRNLDDQPILLMIDDGKFWLMQCILN